MPIIKLLFTPSNDLRRLPACYDTPPPFSTLEKLARKFFLVADDAPLKMTYVDDEGDVVTISSDDELADAFAQARAAALVSLKLSVAPAVPRGCAGRAPRGGAPVHFGVECDLSGMCPIVGARYHLPGCNFDLCESEFRKLDADARSAFVKIERPVARAACRAPCRAPRFARRAGGGGGGGGDDATACAALGSLAAAFAQALDPAAAALAQALDPAAGSAAAPPPRGSAVPPPPPAAAADGDSLAQLVGALGAAAGDDDDALDAELQRAIASSVAALSPAPPASAAPEADRGAAEAKARDDDGYVAVSPPPTPESGALPPTADAKTKVGAPPPLTIDAPPPPKAAAPTTDAPTTTRFDSQLAELASLGFGADSERNVALLDRYNGRVFRVVNAILDMAEGA